MVKLLTISSILLQNEAFSTFFLIHAYTYVCTPQNDQKLMVFMPLTFPGCRNPVFWSTDDLFLKKYLFGIYILWEVSGSKYFPGLLED